MHVSDGKGLSGRHSQIAICHSLLYSADVLLFWGVWGFWLARWQDTEYMISMTTYEPGERIMSIWNVDSLLDVWRRCNGCGFGCPRFRPEKHLTPHDPRQFCCHVLCRHGDCPLPVIYSMRRWNASANVRRGCAPRMQGNLI